MKLRPIEMPLQVGQKFVAMTRGSKHGEDTWLEWGFQHGQTYTVIHVTHIHGHGANYGCAEILRSKVAYHHDGDNIIGDLYPTMLLEDTFSPEEILQAQEIMGMGGDE